MAPISSWPSEVILLVCRLLNTPSMISFLQASNLSPRPLFGVNSPNIHNQTCRKLYLLTDFAYLWADQLRNLISDHGVLGSTFHLPSMSLSELRAAVVRPYLFEQSLLHLHLLHTEPACTAISMPHDREVAFAHLMPGGRWLAMLLYSSRNEKGWLQVWDLQSNQTEGALRVAEYAADGVTPHFWNIQCHDDHAIIVVGWEDEENDAEK